jgi:hypothetical protein
LERYNKYSNASDRGKGLIVAGVQRLAAAPGNQSTPGAAPSFAYHCRID